MKSFKKKESMKSKDIYLPIHTYILSLLICVYVMWSCAEKQRKAMQSNEINEEMLKILEILEILSH